MRKFECSLCHRKFSKKVGAEQHLKDYHKKRQGEAIELDYDDDDTISYAELTIEATRNKEAGLPYEAWLLGE